MTDINKLPINLPVPEDDGAADNLIGMKLPRIHLQATNGAMFDLSQLKSRTVI